MSKITIANVLTMLALAGCSGLTQMQDTVSKFDQGVHFVATGQMAFFRQVQAADCANQFYSAAFLFSTKQTNTLDLTGTCSPTILNDKQIQSRQVLMDSLTLYVDKIQALATNDNNKSLDTNSQNLAGQLNTLAKAHSLSSGLSAAKDVEAAVIGIAEMAMDQRRFDDIRQAAKAMSPHVTILVETLKTENTIFAEGLASKIGAIEPQLHAAVLTARNDEGARSFLDVIAAREIVRSINPLGVSPVSATPGAADPKLDPQNIAKQLNAALDSVKNSNDALAKAGTGGIVAAVNDLIARAQHVNNILFGISK